MNPRHHSLRYYVSLWAGRGLVFTGLFLIQDLVFGFLPFWKVVQVGPIPVQNFLFLATSLYLEHRYFVIRGIE